MSNDALLSVKNLTSGYGNKVILSNISFEVNKNEVVGLLGANGCGKTTLIKSLCRIISSKGEVIVNGTDVSTWSNKVFAQNCSLVPQKSGLGIDISVLDVVLMGFNPYLSLMSKPTKEMVAKAEKQLQNFGLKDRIYDNFQNLSEGQKQIVIISRSLVSDTKVLFMDEPESSLDFAVRYEMLETLTKQIKGADKCALISLHDVNLALKFCDKLLLIKDGGISSVIDVTTEDRTTIEQKLKTIYGDIKLLSVPDNENKESLIMVKA